MSTLKLKIVFYFFLTLGYIALGQERKLLFGEVVVNDNKLLFKEGINVLNKNTNKAVKSDAKGNFSILAKEGDVLVFSSAELDKKLSPHNKKLEIKINAKMLNRELKAHFTLPQNSSKEVIVRPKYNLGSIRQTEKDLENITNSDFGSGNEKLSLNPLDIIGFFSGSYKRQLRAQKRNQKYLKTNTFINRIREYYGDDFFIKQLNVPKNDINNFLEFIANYPPSKELYEKKDFFGLKQMLKRRAEVYLNIEKKSKEKEKTK